MYTKSEIKEMKKGFTPSRTGRDENAIVGRGEEFGNRQERRKALSSKGEHKKIGGIMKIVGSSRWVSRIQIIGNKRIQHWILK